MNAIGCKWVFRIKRKANGTIERYKVRLVSKVFNQVEGEDYFDTFNSIAKPIIVSLLLSPVITKYWSIRKLDFHNPFLNGCLSEIVYMKQPPGYANNFHTHVSKLQKSLYDLK